MACTGGVSLAEGVSLAAAVVAALAALGALYYAWRTVDEAGATRREERRARVAELVGDFAATRLGVLGGGVSEASRRTLTARLRAAIAANGGPLPACTRLADLDMSASPDAIEAAMADALAELSAAP